MGYSQTFRVVPAMGCKRSSPPRDKAYHGSAAISSEGSIEMEAQPTVGCTAEVEVRDNSQSIETQDDDFSLDQALRMWSSGHKVRFSDEVDIREIPMLKELSFVEFCALYMSKRDFDRIECDIATLIMQSKKKHEENGDGSSSSPDEEHSDEMTAREGDDTEGVHADSLRGLEMWLNSSRQEEAVSIVREALRYCGHPDLMAAMYRNCATPCIHAAYMTALDDEQQALSGVLSA